MKAGLATIDDWLAYARGELAGIGAAAPSSWKTRAIYVMLPVVERHVAAAAREQRLIDVTKLLGDLHPVYPFGPRQHHPYKVWLTERKKLKSVINAKPPDVDEFEICKVADDMVQLGRIDEARELLARECPNLLARDCPACGVKYGRPCREPSVPTLVADVTQGIFPWVKPLVDKIIPCQARIQPRADRNPV